MNYSYHVTALFRIPIHFSIEILFPFLSDFLVGKLYQQFFNAKNGKKVNKAHLHISTTIKKSINRKASNNESKTSEEIEERENADARRPFVAALHSR